MIFISHRKVLPSGECNAAFSQRMLTTHSPFVRVLLYK